MYKDKSKVGISKRTPVYANVPINGGSAPTIAPTRVFYEELCFIGRYTHKYENQTAFEIKKV